ncbi:hypothetical protein [Streptomyces sp. NPDC052015]|uniref:hypothetical protein n=1 Tax=Streptomyces sp. NPDC052015 TaxID=3154755 RepID=UPI00343F7F33
MTLRAAGVVRAGVAAAGGVGPLTGAGRVPLRHPCRPQRHDCPQLGALACAPG